MTPEGDHTRVTFDIAVDLLVPLPQSVLKTATKGVLDTATEGLRQRLLSVQEGRG